MQGRALAHSGGADGDKRNGVADSVEGIILDILGLPDIVADPVAVEGMPGNGCIQIIEDTVIVHDDLAGQDLLCRTSIHPYRSGDVTGLKVCRCPIGR